MLIGRGRNPLDVLRVCGEVERRWNFDNGMGGVGFSSDYQR